MSDNGRENGINTTIYVSAISLKKEPKIKKLGIIDALKHMTEINILCAYFST